MESSLNNYNKMSKERIGSILDQFTLRDDVIQLSNDIVVSARNKYHKKNSRNSSNLEGRLGMELRDSRKKKEQNINGYTTELITQRKQETSESKKRDIFTSGNSSHRYRGATSFKVSKTQSMQIDKMNKITALSTTHGYATPDTPFHSSQDLLANHSNRKEKDFKQLFKSFKRQPCDSSYFVLQKKHNKGGGVKDSGVQGWLNQALIEASPNLAIDKMEQNSGLKAYLIDRSALLRLGINPFNISRLYRSFFVYSLGFNNLLKDICHDNKDLRNSIWRVFTVLLEYCSGGNFQTMIGQIQRDKQTKLSEMRSQIEKRQIIIENNDQLSEQKNAKITKQIRQLQDKTKELLSERENILQDYHEAEQAFNQEIALRLKYETRINEIHGVYEELRQKFNLLKQQNEKNMAQIKIQKETIEAQRVQISQNLGQLHKKSQLLSNLQSQRASLFETFENLEKSSKTSGINYLSAKHASETSSQVATQKCRKIQQLELTIKNMKASQKSLLLTLKSKSDEFQRAMKQNSELHENAHKSIIAFNELMEKNRILGHSSTQISAEMAIVHKKYKEKEQILAETNAKLIKTQQQLSQKQVDLLAHIQKCESLQKDLQSCHENIKEMKQKQNELSTLLQEANTKIDLLSETISSKQQEQQKHIIQIQMLKNRIQEHKTQIKQKQSRIMTLQESIKALKQIMEAKYFKLEEQHLKIKEQCTKYEKERDGLFTQIEANKQKYEKVYLEFKNERFQRNNLDLYYKQSLAVMQQEIQHIKKLNIKISQMSETIEEGKRKYNTFEMIMKHKVELLEADVQFWKDQFMAMERKAKERQMYVHPMLYEDACGISRRLKEQTEIITLKCRKLEKKIKQLELLKCKYEQEAKNVGKNQDHGLQAFYKNQVSKRDGQIVFLKQKIEYQNQKIAQAQEVAAKANKQRILLTQNSRKAQTQFMEKISQKSKELQELNEKYRAILHLNETQLKQNERLSHKNEEQRSHYLHKIEQLTYELKSYENRLKIPLKQNKQRNPTKISHNEHDNHRNKLAHDQPQAHPVSSNQSDLKSGWNEEGQPNYQQQLQKLESKEEILGEPTDPNVQSVEAFKKREGIRKKIKGAYLYYCK